MPTPDETAIAEPVVPAPLPDVAADEDPDLAIRDLVTDQAGAMFEALARWLKTQKHAPVRSLRLAEAYAKHLREFLGEVAVPDEEPATGRDRLAEQGYVNLRQLRQDQRRERAAAAAGFPGVPFAYGGGGPNYAGPGLHGLQLAPAPPRQGRGVRAEYDEDEELTEDDRRMLAAHDERRGLLPEGEVPGAVPATPALVPTPVEDAALDLALARLDADQLPGLLDSLERAQRLNQDETVAYCKAQIAAIVGPRPTVQTIPLSEASVAPAEAAPQADPDPTPTFTPTPEPTP